MFPLAACRPKGLVGGGLALPLGAIGAWFMDAYKTSPRRYIPNEATSIPAGTNLVSAPRRMFASGNMYGRFNCTVVDNAVSGPDGLTEATTVISTGANDWQVQNGSVPLPVGTYTMGLDMRSHDGTAQSVRLRNDSGAGGSTQTVCAVTTSWQRFTHTFTWGGGNVDLCWGRSIDGATAGSIEICGATLSPGAVDLGEGATNLAGHIMLGRTTFDAAGTVASGIYVPGASGAAVAQFASDQSFQTITIIAIARRARSGGFAAAIARALGTKFQLTVDSTGVAASDFNGTSIPGYSTITRCSELWTFLNKGWFVHGMTYDDAKGEQWLNRSRLFRRSFSVGTVLEKDLYIGASAAATSYAATDADIAALAIWNRALSDTEYATAVATMLARVASKSSITPTVNRVIINEGDSITFAGTPVTTGGYTRVAAASYSPVCYGYNQAVIGDDFTNLNVRAPFTNQIPKADGGKYILTVMDGYNDWLHGRTTAQYLVDYAAYYTAAKAGGWTDVVAISVIPSSTSPGLEAWRNVTNAALAAGVGTYCDHFCDTDPVTGTGSAGQTWATANTYDGIHPSDAGHAALAPQLVTVINAI